MKDHFLDLLANIFLSLPGLFNQKKYFMQKFSTSCQQSNYEVYALIVPCNFIKIIKNYEEIMI